MKNIRLATLVKITIPLIVTCALVIVIIFAYYQSAMQQENEFLNATIEGFGVTLAPHVVERMAEVQARSATLYLQLTLIITFFIILVLAALFIITYKLAPLRNLAKVASMLSKDDMDSKIIDVPNDELGNLTIELAHMMKAADEHLLLLEDALEKANAASKAKGDFLANMSHEIRTPMNAIIGMTNIALNAQSSDRKDYALKKIEEASTHLLGVINDILDMSKIEADKLELHPETFILEDMIKKVTNIMTLRVTEKYQNFAVYIDENTPGKLFADDQRLAQVLTNLLSNAVKFTPENGSITLSIKLLSEEDGLYKIQFDVVDTGVGISEEQMGALFEAFEQAESSTTRKYGGTGLGLTIAKKIVELMGGEISVRSSIGEGSTFTFTILAGKPSGESECIHRLKQGIDKEELKILVVDDERDIREYFADITARFEISCDIAASGEEAIRLLESGKSYDICFIDWKMPNGMDGIELVQQVKKKKPGNFVTIMISSAEWQEIASEAKEAGVDKFLPKPIFPSAFAECINQYLGIDLMNTREKEDDTADDHFWGYNILLAEDVELNREIVMAMLESTKVNIDCAENGAEAVRMFREAPDKYNIIFMDMQMPVQDGLSATKEIRMMDVEKAKTIPIIAMTANVFKDDIENCLQVGMNDHIGKPLDFDRVMYILRKYLYQQVPAKNRRFKKRRKSEPNRRHLDDRRVSERRKSDEAAPE